ncbi:hypothetical protein FJ930_18335 [Mesorhizobium sp. B2-4-15]|uniref:hypothetical protein n=1 Tax=Mesorhizobium sp. B2-4-15 TaxID=2589934 RepID=UPI001153C0A9|nr:hypothetical protein [Mesorhizobium sp. B2-4-15]TPK70284.1 hypothetical protein FJ930_18335 [Mesorhizobium sp. B2-4-15]
MSAFFRRRIESTIEHLIGVLNELDGDADLEPETVEEQHDLPVADRASVNFVLAEAARQYRAVKR